VTNEYQALLFVSFGGPEGPDDVMPFLENVLRGRNVPRERMLEVAEHYNHFGGVSPINEQNRTLISALEAEFKQHDVSLPIYFGNRNWTPLLPDTLQQMKDDGITKAIAFFTSPYSSYSGCRQYRENIIAAREQVEGAPEIDKLRVFFNHPGFIAATTDLLKQAAAQIPTDRLEQTRVLYTAHSIPLSMADNCSYVAQLEETCRLTSEAAGFNENSWQLVYQSRSGPPTQPWLEPDICDAIETLANEGVKDVIINPIGFISDHMEVMFDLDEEARDKAAELGVNMVRCATVGVHPQFVTMIRELVEERMSQSKERPALGKMPASHDVCPLDCCEYTPRRPARS